MDEIATLGLFAQLAVALTGFAGLLAAFRGGRDGWAPIEIAGLKILLMTSVAAMGLAVIPVPMLIGGWSDARAFGLSSLLMGAHFALAFAVGLRMVFAQKLRPRRPLLFSMLMILLAPFAALLLLSGFGVDVDFGPIEFYAGDAGLYCAGLLLLIVIAAAQFLFQVIASIAPAAG